MRIRAAIVLLMASGVLSAAGLPYAGRWKMNVAKSDFGATTVTYEQMANGDVKVTADGLSFSFKTDGKDYPTPWGTMTAWKSVDARTWESTDKVNGKVASTAKVRLSADGKTLTIDAKNVKADGEASNDTTVFDRVAGGPGLAGRWKTKNFKISRPATLDLAQKGADGLTLTYVDEKGVCDAKLDGKDYPATGPMWPSGWTCSTSRNGERGFDLLWKKDGKDLYKSTLTVSADGKTMTEAGGAVGTSERTTVVYDRQ